MQTATLQQVWDYMSGWALFPWIAVLVFLGIGFTRRHDPVLFLTYGVMSALPIISLLLVITFDLKDHQLSLPVILWLLTLLPMALVTMWYWIVLLLKAEAKDTDRAIRVTLYLILGPLTGAYMWNMEPTSNLEIISRPLGCILSFGMIVVGLLHLYLPHFDLNIPGPDDES